jgi:hypothetical protein
MERALITAVHVACDSRRGGCGVLCSVASAVPRERVNETSRRVCGRAGDVQLAAFFVPGCYVAFGRLVNISLAQLFRRSMHNRSCMFVVFSSCVGARGVR